MHWYMRCYPQEEASVQRAGIPVENSEFSTLSTDFSTGVIHRRGRLWIFIFSSHNCQRRISRVFPLFRGLCHFTMASFLCKKRVLTKAAGPPANACPGWVAVVTPLGMARYRYGCTNCSLAASRRGQCVHGAEGIATSLTRSVSLLR